MQKNLERTRSYDVKSYQTKSCNKFFPRSTGTLLERFWSKISPEPNSGCWLWGGDTNGVYGSIGVYENGKTKKYYAHRISYELHKGPIPKGLEIDHICRMKFCVNPDHLRAVTRWENVMHIPAGMRGNYQISEYCKRGHHKVGRNLVFTDRGQGACRECLNMHSRNFFARKRERAAREAEAQSHSSEGKIRCD